MSWHHFADPAAAGNRRLRHLVFGLGLVALGIVSLLGYTGAIRPLPAIDLLPGLLGVSGIAIMVSARRARQAIKGLVHVGVALWLLACLEHWHGLHPGSAWPLLLILFGASALLRALTDNYRIAKP